MDQARPYLFGHTQPVQGEMFAASEMRKSWQPKPIDPKYVRGLLHRMLEQITAATDELPWPIKKARYNRTVFPQMANWLPHEEAEDLRAKFRAQLERFGM
jgi:hypothetical protein